MTTDREEAIRIRAHQLWEEGGRTQGRHDDHWAQAEREIHAGREDGPSEAGAAPDDPAAAEAASNSRHAA